MGKNLVVVESPAKAKTLSRYLGKDYVVTASKGHVKDLPTKELGVDIGAGFVPQYVPMRGKGALLKEICKLGKSADTIYLAPDPDREGEAIAWHIAEELRSGKQQPKNVYRVLITEITKNGVKDAFTRPLQLNENRYNSQQARRILDRLVGYQLSPLLWDKVRRGLSAGRVQSVAVRLIVDREREIAAFQPVEYWKIEVNVEGQTPPDFWARLHRYKGEEIPVGDGTHAAAVVEALEAADYVITRVERKERRRQPQPPFITSTLQQDAIRKLHMNAKRTMQVAQKLYEGIPLGEEGPTGLITYMRTDSTRVSDQAIDGVRAYIGDRYSARHLPVKPRTFAKSKKAQDAHEAIRPSDVNRTPDSVKAHLNRDQFRLYQLIWRRFVASQMADALYDGTSVDIQAGDYTLRATGSVLTFAGWLDVYTEADAGRTERRQRSADPRRGPAPREARGARRAEVHEAAAPLHGGDPGQGARVAGHRSPFDVREHHLDHPGQGLRRVAGAPLLPHGAGDGRDRPARRELPRRAQHRVHGGDGGRARQDRGGHRRLGRGAEQLLRAVPRRPRQGPQGDAGPQA